MDIVKDQCFQNLGNLRKKFFSTWIVFVLKICIPHIKQNKAKYWKMLTGGLGLPGGDLAVYPFILESPVHYVERHLFLTHRRFQIVSSAIKVLKKKKNLNTSI